MQRLDNLSVMISPCCAPLPLFLPPHTPSGRRLQVNVHIFRYHCCCPSPNTAESLTQPAQSARGIRRLRLPSCCSSAGHVSVASAKPPRRQVCTYFVSITQLETDRSAAAPLRLRAPTPKQESRRRMAPEATALVLTPDRGKRSPLPFLSVLGRSRFVPPLHASSCVW